MKIGGSGKSGSASGPKKTSSSQDGGDVDFSRFVSGGADETAQTSATQSIAQLDALLAVQEVEDPLQKAAKKRVKVRANTILDKLENLRIKMLCGDLTVGHMVDIADVVASHRDKVEDPALTSLMDEVDLRAQVELAKMRVALDKA
ncbi:MAG: flagellar assembly protein FliX [Alphaproteobacteria bacterium]